MKQSKLQEYFFTQFVKFDLNQIDGDLGTCCTCGCKHTQENPVVNLLNLPWQVLEPGFTWGNKDWNLPLKGAIAVICDRCFDLRGCSGIKHYIVGYLEEKRRGLISDLSDRYEYRVPLSTLALIKKNNFGVRPVYYKAEDSGVLYSVVCQFLAGDINAAELRIFKLYLEHWLEFGDWQDNGHIKLLSKAQKSCPPNNLIQPYLAQLEELKSVESIWSWLSLLNSDLAIDPF